MKRTLGRAHTATILVLTLSKDAAAFALRVLAGTAAHRTSFDKLRARAVGCADMVMELELFDTYIA
jgi:hypothetical protein